MRTSVIGFVFLVICAVHSRGTGKVFTYRAPPAPVTVQHVKRMKPQSTLATVQPRPSQRIPIARPHAPQPKPAQPAPVPTTPSQTPTTPSFWEYLFGFHPTTAAPLYFYPSHAPVRFSLSDCDCFRDLETCPRGHYYGGECHHGDGIQCCEG